MPAIDVENAWGLDATSYGNHEFDYGVARLLQHQDRANFPFLGVNIVETATGDAPSWVKPSKVFSVNGLKIGVIGAELQNTPELVSAGATAGLTFLAEVPRIRAESERLRKQGVKIQVLLIHQGTNVGTNTINGTLGVPWARPNRRFREPAPGYDDRRNHRWAHPPCFEPDGRQHPGHRGHQRRRILLGTPAAGQGRRCRVGRRRDTGGKEPGCGAAAPM